MYRRRYELVEIDSVLRQNTLRHILELTHEGRGKLGDRQESGKNSLLYVEILFHTLIWRERAAFLGMSFDFKLLYDFLHEKEYTTEYTYGVHWWVIQLIILGEGAVLT